MIKQRAPANGNYEGKNGKISIHLEKLHKTAQNDPPWLLKNRNYEGKNRKNPALHLEKCHKMSENPCPHIWKNETK